MLPFLYFEQKQLVNNRRKNDDLCVRERDCVREGERETRIGREREGEAGSGSGKET